MTQEGFYNRPQAYFEWPVPDAGFVWKSNLVDAFSPSPKRKPPFLIQHPDTTRINRTLPLEDETTLFTEFAALPTDKDSILEFANQHGNLDGGIALAPKAKSFPGFLSGVPLASWGGEVATMAAYLKLWEAVDREDKKALAAYIEWPDRFSVVFHFRDIPMPPKVRNRAGQDHYSGTLATAESKPDLFGMFAYGDVLLPARHLLQKSINGTLKEHRVSPRLLLNTHGQLDSYLMPESLIAALWLQFYHAAAREQRFKRCPICEKYENVTRRRSDWDRHASCAAKRRAARSYERQKKAAKK